MSKRGSFVMKAHSATVRQLGFSLIELMIAITLGILVGIGIVMLFSVTSKTNHVQEMMSEMQENGRYAVQRINNDLRLASRQLMSASGYADPNYPNASLSQAANSYVNPIPFQDVVGGIGPPAGWPTLSSANPSWPLSPAYMMRAYACTAASCNPSTVPGWIPTMGTAVNNRVPNSDVLIVHYLSTNGWSTNMGDAGGLEIRPTCAANGSLAKIDFHSVTQVSGTYTYTSPALNFQAGDLALLADSSGNMEIFAVAGPGPSLVPSALAAPATGGIIKCLGSTPGSSAAPAGEVKLFNFTRDFITVAYWLRVTADPSVAGRVIPALVRTQVNNTGKDSTGAALASTTTDHQVIVQGVEQMNFLFGVQEANGNIAYLTADQVGAQSTANSGGAAGNGCTPPPGQYVATATGSPPVVTYEAGACFWRSLQSVEVHLLVDSVNNLFSLTQPERAYRYMPSPPNADPVNAPASSGTMPNGISAGAMMRREFITLVSMRNYNS